MIRKLAGLGLNYTWGLLNFAAGVSLGGCYVAALMLSPKLLSAAQRLL